MAGFSTACWIGPPRQCGLLAQCLRRWDDADAYFRRALAANRRAGATLYVAHTLRQHAGLLLARDGTGDRNEADAMLAEANSAYRQLGLDHWITQQPDTRPAPDTGRNVFRRDGETWVLRYGDLATRVRDVKGLSTLSRLLAEPGREIHVLDLVGGGDRDERFAASGHTGEVIDAQAREAYRRRLAELDAELDDATLTSDTGRALRARHERDALVEQLTAAYGLGGRARHGNDPIQRARSTVTKQIRNAIARIEQGNAPLARHLTNAVKTGRYCSNTPDHPTNWDL